MPERDNAISEVREDVTMCDTVLIGPGVRDLEYNTGWDTSFAATGRHTRLNFFNVRSRVHGLAYSNSDSIDRSPYKLEITKIRCEFFGPGGSLQIGADPAFDDAIEPQIFLGDLVYHCGLSFFVQKDERLASPAALCSAGAGIVGSGAIVGTAGNTAPLVYSSASSGVQRLKNGFQFAGSIIIPDGSTYSVELEISEYARQLLQKLSGPGSAYVWKDIGNGPELVATKIYYGIRILLDGKRFVAQRGMATA